jgi:FixJ family two-component response regulator
MTTVSIIDDNRVAREAIADLVSSLGYEVATYESAQDFLD